MEEKKYEDVLKGIIKIIRNAEHSDIGFASICTYIGDHCPELESEDERIRRFLHKTFTAQYLAKDKLGKWHNEPVTNILAYLEKVKDFDEQLEQAYKNSDEVQYKRGYDDGYVDGMAAAKKKELEKQGEKPQGKSAVEAAKEEKSDNRNCINNADKDEHEFQVGDWVISKRNRNVYHILNIEDNEYQVETLYGIFWYDKLYFEGFCRHWNIDDAKPGDVLANSQSIFIFKRIYMAGKPEAYYAVMNDSFKSFIKCPNACWTNEQCHPATKEQRELFFRKIEEKGFEWNATTKELNRKEDTKKSDKVWSEEDEELLNSIYVTLEGIAPLSYKKELDWLKTIKGRIS